MAGFLKRCYLHFANVNLMMLIFASFRFLKILFTRVDFFFSSNNLSLLILKHSKNQRCGFTRRFYVNRRDFEWFFS